MPSLSAMCQKLTSIAHSQCRLCAKRRRSLWTEQLALERSNSSRPQRGVITKSVGGTRVEQLVSTAFKTSKKSRTMACAHSLAAGEGLPTATCATLGISTTVEFGSVRATSGAKDGVVCASNCDAMTSVGRLLCVTSRIDRSTGDARSDPRLGLTSLCDWPCNKHRLEPARV